MATISTCLLLVWAVLGVGTYAAVLPEGRHEGAKEVDVSGKKGDPNEESGRRPDVSNGLQDVLQKAHKGLYDYPTSFTQGIITVRESAPSALLWT